MANVVYTNDGVLLSRVMREHLNKWPERPSDVMLEDHSRELPSMMLQQLAAAKVKRAYINGSYIGSWMFSVYIQIDGKDTATRLDALKCLTDLDEWLNMKDPAGHFINLPVIDPLRRAIQVIMPNAPSVSAKYESGVEEYQAIFEMEYKYSM